MCIRDRSVDFSDAYAMAQLAILANADSGVASIDDLNQPGKKVAVKTGSTGDVYATKNLTNAEIVRLADESACVTEVVQGKADGFLYDQLTIYRNHQANPDTTEAVFIPFQDADVYKRQFLHPALSHGCALSLCASHRNYYSDTLA